MFDCDDRPGPLTSSSHLDPNHNHKLPTGQSIGFTDSVNSLVLNGHLSDQVAQGYCAGMPKVVLTDGGKGFEATIHSMDVPGAIGHIQQDRKMWFTSENGSGDGGVTSSKGSHARRRHLLRRE